MKKNLFSAGLIGLLALGYAASLTSCDNGDNPAKGTVKVGDGVNAFDMWASVEEKDHVVGIIEKYNELARAKGKENLTVTISLIPMSEGEIGYKFRTDAKSCPVIFHHAGDNDWHTKSQLTGLFTATEYETLKSQVNDQPINVNLDNIRGDGSGSYYSLPFTANTYFLMYDKNVFTAEDVKDMESMRKVLVKWNTTHDADHQYQYMIGGELGDNGWQLASIFSQDGVLLQGPDGTSKETADNGFLQDTDKIVTNVSRFLYSYQHKFDKGLGEGKEGGLLFNVNTATSMTSDHKNTPNNFPAWIGGTWNLKDLQKAAGADNVASAPLPDMYNPLTIGAQEAEANIAWPMLNEMKYVSINNEKFQTYNKNPQLQEAVMELVYFMFTKEGQAFRYTGEQMTPAVVKEELEIDAMKNYPCNEGLAGATSKNTYPSFSTPGMLGGYYADAGAKSLGNTFVFGPDVTQWDSLDTEKKQNAFKTKLTNWVISVGNLIEKANGNEVKSAVRLALNIL